MYATCFSSYLWHIKYVNTKLLVKFLCWHDSGLPKYRLKHVARFGWILVCIFSKHITSVFGTYFTINLWAILLFYIVLPVSARELARYILDLVGVQEVGGQRVYGKSRGFIIFFPMEMKTNIINWKPGFSYTTERYKELRE